MSDFGTLKKINTRKPHQCLFCGRTIPVKTEAFNFKGYWENEWQNWYSCAICNGNDDISGDSAEGINGTEFQEWAYEQKWADCPKCKANYSDIEFVWSDDEKTLEFECQACGEKWEHFIGFEAKEATQ